MQWIARISRHKALIPIVMTLLGVILFSVIKQHLLEINGVATLSQSELPLHSPSDVYHSTGNLFQFLMPATLMGLNFYLLFMASYWFSADKYACAVAIICTLIFDCQLSWHIYDVWQHGIVLPIIKVWPMAAGFLGIIAGIALALPWLLQRQLRKPMSQASSAPDQKVQIAQKHNPFIQHLNQIIDKHIAEESLNSQILAEKLYMSEKTLRRKLHQHAGLTPATYLKNRRLDHAHQLMQQRRLSGKQIAAAVGFRSSSYFQKLYQQRFELLPDTTSEGAYPLYQQQIHSQK